MKKFITFAAALCVSAEALAQDVCTGAAYRMRAMKNWGAAVMDDPKFGATVFAPGPQVARPGLLLAQQTVTVAPRLKYLAAPVSLADTDGHDLANSIPLGRGAPISFWRGAGGVKPCAFGWKNGLFGKWDSSGRLRWVCFEDRDGDGKFDNAWRPWTKNLGLSFGKLDMPISPAVAVLDAPPTESGPKLDERAIVDPSDVKRSIVVTRADGNSLRLEYRIERDHFRRTIERKDVQLAGALVEVTLAGIRVAVAPSAGGATVIGSGDFDRSGVRLMCDGSRIVIGGFEFSTEFVFPNW